MPELPEVETIARDLRPLVRGARIESARCDWPNMLRSRDPEAFRRAVAGRTIEDVGRRGKQLLLALSGSADDPAPAVLTIHLKMTGQLFVVPAAAPADRYVHLALGLAGGRELRFRDIRKFGRVGLYRRDEATGEPIEGEAAGVLASGAEPLDPSFTVRALRELLGRRRGRLKSLLMDQTFLAGVGNIYADEALWRARLHPLRLASTIRAEEVRRLHRALVGVLQEAVERRGSSVDDYTAPEGDGSMQEHLRVYQRAGEPCERCGRPVRRIVVGGRATHFCSWCQRLSAAERRASAAVLRAAGTGRRGPRWAELDGEGAIGRRGGGERPRRDPSGDPSRDPARDVASRPGGARSRPRTVDPAERRRRVEVLRAAAAARRAAARGAADTAGAPDPSHARNVAAVADLDGQERG